jgi:hypothetical protein
MCKLTGQAPYCDQSCRTRFTGMQYHMGNAVEGTYSNMKSFLNTVPKGLDNYRKFADERQEQLERAETVKKKFYAETDTKNKKKKTTTNE